MINALQPNVVLTYDYQGLIDVVRKWVQMNTK